jgi:hypothetical protein
MSREQDDMLRRGIGMTSQRTRERLIQRLYEEGLSNAKVLEVIRRTPRHLFVDERWHTGPTKTPRYRSGITRPSPSLIWSLA